MINLGRPIGDGARTRSRWTVGGAEFRTKEIAGGNGAACEFFAARKCSPFGALTPIVSAG
jgi:hypothetical protein